MARRLAALVLVIAAWAAGPVAASTAQTSQCPGSAQGYNESCGPTFTLPPWGDAGGWTEPDQYSTIHLADVLGTGRDQLIARGAAGIEIWEFDTTFGQWRPHVDAANKPMILTAFADPPPLTEANPNPVATDWTLAKYYSSIQTADLLGTGREQIIARSSAGVLIYSYTPGANGAPGTWDETQSGAFNDEPNAIPFWFPTIGTAQLTGASRQLWGIDASWALRALRWDPLTVLDPGAGAPSFPPGVPAATLQVSPPIDGQQELWYLTPQGMQGLRLTPQGDGFAWTADTRANAPFRYDGSAPAGGTPWDQDQYASTIRFADIAGSSDVVVVGRGVDGLEAYRLTATGWQQLATLPALSDEAGYDQSQYYSSLTYADLDGFGGDEVIVRGPHGVQAYTYDAAGDRWGPMPGLIDLEDDPWGSDPSLYTTFRAGDASGSGREDTLVARGPYGIRTWFYDRPGQQGWGPYLPPASSAYPDFAGTDTTGELGAYNDLSSRAVTSGALPGDDTKVRDVWLGGNAPLVGDLDVLQPRLVALGGCTMSQDEFAPPRALACVPPSGSSGYSAGEWTSVLNQLFAELYYARTVAAFYADVDGARANLYIAENTSLPAIGDKLGLDGLGNTDAEFDPDGLISGALGIAASVLYEQPELSSDLWVASEITSMIPSASPSLSDSFQGTYTQLQGVFAEGISDADAASRAQNFQVRSDYNLVRFVAQLRQRGTWSFDRAGFASVGAQAFTEWVYKALLPSVYGRYDITSCQGTAVGFIRTCSAPPAGPWASVANPATFHDVEALPHPNAYPCRQYLQSFRFDCAFSGPDAATVNTVSAPVSKGCTYTGPNATPVWTFGKCTLGVPATRILDPPPLLTSAKDDWPLPDYSGNPFPFGETSLTGTATKETRTRNATVKLIGRVRTAGRVDLRGARVAVDRMLGLPDGGGDLVHKVPRGSRRPADGVRTRPADPVVLRQTSRGRFRSARAASAAQRRTQPRIGVKLTPAGKRRLRFQLDVANVVMPRHLPTVCGQATARATFAPRRVPLRMKLRILRPGKRPLVIRARPSFACRYDRSGALRGLRVQPARRAPKLGRGLSVRLDAPRRLAAGQTGTLTATVRNRRRKAAHDVRVQASLPRGLRIVRAGARARVRSPQVGWRLERLRRGRSRTFRVTVRAAATGGARRCSQVTVQARVRRGTRARACVRVG